MSLNFEFDRIIFSATGTLLELHYVIYIINIYMIPV